MLFDSNTKNSCKRDNIWERLCFKLIDWLGFNAVFNHFSVISCRPVHLLMHFLVFSHQYPTQQSSQATGCFFRIDLAHWWKTNDACRIDFCQSSERKLAEPGSNSQLLDWQPASLPTELPGLGFMFQNECLYLCCKTMS